MKLIINVGRSEVISRAVQHVLYKAGCRWQSKVGEYLDMFKAYLNEDVAICVSNKVMTYASVGYFKANSGFDGYKRVDAATEFGKLSELLSVTKEIKLKAGYPVPEGYIVGSYDAKVYIKKGEYAQVGCVRATVQQLKEILAAVEGK